MIKYIKAVYELKTITKCNMFIYYLEKIPLLGKYVSYFLFKHTELKKAISIVTTILSIVVLAVIKFLCIVIFGVGVIWYLSDKLKADINNYDAYYFQTIFFLFCVLGAFQESRAFIVTKTKYICFTQIKIPVKEGIISFLINEYLVQFISIGLTFGIFCIALLDNKYFFVLLISYISMQLFSECIHLMFFKSTGSPLEKRKIFSLFLFGTSLIGAYGPLLISDKLLIENVLTNNYSILTIIIIAIMSVYYIFSYDAYDEKLVALFRKEDLVEELARKKQASIYNSDVEIEMISFPKTPNLQGFNLLNSIFVLRNRKNLFKYLKRRLVFISLVFGFAIVCFLYNPMETGHILKNIYLFAPLLPLMIVMFSYGEGFCKFYYNNCDSRLLMYSFYRTRKAILQNYFIKLRYILKYNLILGMVTAIYILVLFCIAKIEIWNSMFWLFEITIIVMLLAFGIQHLSVYYLLQPYIKESTVQNPVLFIVQMPMLMLTYVLAMISLPAMMTY